MNYPFLTERIDLPSKGLVYPKENPLSKGYVDMRYMTAYHEDILTNINYIKRGVEYTIDKFCESLFVGDTINYEDLIEGDRFQLMIASRILSYGKDVEYEFKDKSYKVDLSQLPNKEIDYSLFKNKNEVEFELPYSGIKIGIKLLTHGDLIWIEEEEKRLKLISRNPDEKFTNQLKLKKMIVSIEGDYTQETIDEFISNKLIGRDIREIFLYYKEISPEVDITVKDSDGGEDYTIPFSYFELFYDIK